MNLNALLGYNSLSLFYLCRSNFSTVATLLTFSSFFEEGEKKVRIDRREKSQHEQ